MLINVYVFIFLMGESIAPCAWSNQDEWVRALGKTSLIREI